MISINELYQEVKSDEELRSKFLTAYGKGEIEGFLKENECDATAEEALEFIEQELRSGSYELSDEELALVVGGEKGKGNSDSGPKYHDGDYVSYKPSGWDCPCYGHIVGNGEKEGMANYYYYNIRQENGVTNFHVAERNINRM